MAGQAVLTQPETAFLAHLAKRWPDKLSRLRGGFYDVKDKTGAQVPFRMNADQEDFILNRHGLDVILKARQRGFTTVIQLDMLDDCLFTSNLSAGVIAHNLKDAKAFFSDKIKFAYPPEHRERDRQHRSLVPVRRLRLHPRPQGPGLQHRLWPSADAAHVGDQHHHHPPG